MSMTRSRLIDWSFLRNWGYALNLWAHLHILYEFLFAGLIWNRFTRPIMLWAGLVLWPLMLLASGLVTFCLLMVVANLAHAYAVSGREREAHALLAELEGAVTKRFLSPFWPNHPPLRLIGLAYLRRTFNRDCWRLCVTSFINSVTSRDVTLS